MRSLVVCLIAVLVVGIITPDSCLSADRWNATQKEVWKATEDSWAATQAKDKAKILAFSHPEGIDWSYEEAIPVDADNIRKAINYWFDQNWVMEFYLIQPMEIIVTGTTAVCAYQYAALISMEDSEKQKEESGRYIETWVKEGGKWLLLAGHGGEIEKDDSDN